MGECIWCLHTLVHTVIFWHFKSSWPTVRLASSCACVPRADNEALCAPISTAVCATEWTPALQSWVTLVVHVLAKRSGGGRVTRPMCVNLTFCFWLVLGLPLTCAAEVHIAVVSTSCGLPDRLQWTHGTRGSTGSNARARTVILRSLGSWAQRCR